jgi:predicted transcriptional regulator
VKLDINLGIMQKEPLRPTESELIILQILWEVGPASVRAINDRMNKTKNVGYTTTLKLLQIMTDKGLVSRVKEGRNHIYSAAVEQQKAQQQLLDKLLTNVFGGSAKKLVLQALGNHQPSEKELEEIRNYIDGLKNQTP